MEANTHGGVDLMMLLRYSNVDRVDVIFIATSYGVVAETLSPTPTSVTLHRFSTETG